MPIIQGKQALLELLVQESVDVMFGNPGSTELELMDALAVDDRVRYVLGLQEAAVVAMADGYGQATGRLCAVNLHAAPGLGNALGMLYNAKRSNVPLLITAGQQDSGFNLTEPLLWDDLVTIARPFVKWAFEVNSLAELPRAVHRAAKVALTPPKGPVFLSLPGNVLAETAEIDLLDVTRIASELRGEIAAIDRAAQLIVSSRSPIILVGDAVAEEDALDEAASLAELIGAPVYAESMANRASFRASHPLFAGTITRLPSAVRQVLDEHDLVLSIGADLFTHSLADPVEAVPSGIQIIHIDSDAWQLGKNYPTEVPILATMKSALPELHVALERRMTEANKKECRLRADTTRSKNAQRRDSLIKRARDAAKLSPIKPLALLHALGEALPANVIVIEELLSSSEGVRLLLPSNDSQSFYSMRGGGIGWGLAAAVGAKIGVPNRPVVALIGDGSSMFTVQALWTAARERLGIIFVVFNNASYRILKQRTRALNGYAAQTSRYVAMDLDDPPIDFESIARGLGVNAATAYTIPEAMASLKIGLSDGRPLLIDVRVDASL